MNAVRLHRLRNVDAVVDDKRSRGVGTDARDRSGLYELVPNASVLLPELDGVGPAADGETGELGVCPVLLEVVVREDVKSTDWLIGGRGLSVERGLFHDGRVRCKANRSVNCTFEAKGSSGAVRLLRDPPEIVRVSLDSACGDS